METKREREYVVGAYAPCGELQEGFRGIFSSIEEAPALGIVGAVEKANGRNVRFIAELDPDAERLARSIAGGALVAEFPSEKVHVVSLEDGRMELLGTASDQLVAGVLVRSGLLPAAALALNDFPSLDRDQLIALSCLSSWRSLVPVASLGEWGEAVCPAIETGRVHACDLVATRNAQLPADPEDRIADAQAFRRLYAATGRAHDCADAVRMASSLRCIGMVGGGDLEAAARTWLEVIDRIGGEGACERLLAVESVESDLAPECALAAREAYESLRDGDAMLALGLESTLERVLADARASRDEEFDRVMQAICDARAS